MLSCIVSTVRGSSWTQGVALLSDRVQDGFEQNVGRDRIHLRHQAPPAVQRDCALAHLSCRAQPCVSPSARAPCGLVALASSSRSFVLSRASLELNPSPNCQQCAHVYVKKDRQVTTRRYCCSGEQQCGVQLKCGAPASMVS